MPEQKKQLPVTVTEDNEIVTVELNPEDLINLRDGEEIDTVSITLAGKEVARIQRFEGLPPGVNPASLN